MSYLYLILNIASFSIPFVYSFEKKRMHYIEHSRVVFGSILFVAFFFLLWDAIFTHYQIWKFNSKYHTPWLILKMPIEEYMFFICIPYASIFLHYALDYFFPRIRLSVLFTKTITLVLFCFSLIISLIYHFKAYTFVSFMVLSFALGLGYLKGIPYLRSFYLHFLVILIPFFLINGVLTGMWIEDQVVWYNPDENLNIRWNTIPVEDISYAFSMLFFSILIIEKYKNKPIV